MGRYSQKKQGQKAEVVKWTDAKLAEIRAYNLYVICPSSKRKTKNELREAWHKALDRVNIEGKIL